ncbi:Glucose dehydrogenase [FAD, quinone] [Leucoagaricus sp. SymC.cos]|nr:Glucose dehydrogenase [FAD, quinone] [Leucoagaricus sp. SymC.cos]
MNRKFQALLIFILSTFQVTLSAVLLHSPDDLPNNPLDNYYDFVIAGAGTAGAVVASRLAEANPQWKVLVVEAGPSNEDVFETRVPGLWLKFLSQEVTRVDWNYTVAPQVGLNGRSVGYSRARMLGGCSSHNAMTYTRGSRDDWDRYANVVKDDAYKWDNVLPLFFKAERLTQQVPKGHIDPSVHGRKGKVSVSATFTKIPFNDMLIKASDELKAEFPFLLDMNAGRVIGTGWVQSTLDHGERSSSATAYLAKSGDNVHILINTQVTRVVPANSNGSEFRGVEVATDAQAPRRTIIAKKEVIVSGGIIGSPQILLNSGIGSREELEKVGVKTLVDNPSVGKNLTDQVSTPMAFATNTTSTDFDQEAALEEWNKTRTGPLSHPVDVNHFTFVRLPQFSEEPLDPTGGSNSPHVEFAYSGISSHPPVVGGPAQIPPGSANVTIQLAVANLHPVSRGSITLASSNPFDHPVIDFRLLTESEDIAILREGIRSARRLFAAPAFKDAVFGSVLPAPNVTSDEDLDAYIRSTASPFLHSVGSAMMSARGASWGVVDPDFRVKGTKGLRVVDASVIPLTPSGHSQVAVYAMAERASMLIAEAWE